MTQLLWISLGGALGTGARFMLTTWAARVLGAGFPYGTLLVNVLGSFLISWVMVLSTDAGAIPPPVRLFLTTGVLGGFTTYSAFNYETLKLFYAGQTTAAAGNLMLTVVLCTGAGVLGLLAGARVAAALG